MDIESSKISKITNISEGMLCKIFKQIRILITKECEKISKLNGEIEIDESYFFASFHSQLQAEGANRVRGKRGRGAGRKTPVFGMLKRNSCVWTQIVKNCSTNELLLIKTPLFELKLKRTLHNCSDLKESIIYSDTLVAYDGLVDYGTKAHYRIK